MGVLLAASNFSYNFFRILTSESEQSVCKEAFLSKFSLFFRLKEDELFKKNEELEAKNDELERLLSEARGENKRLRSKLRQYETQDEFCPIDDELDDN